MLARFMKKKIQTSKENKNEKELIDKVTSMDLIAMRHYVVEENPPLVGITEVAKKLVTRDKRTNQRFIEENASSFKIQKSVNLFEYICEHCPLSDELLKLLQIFPYVYSDIISAHDESYKKQYSEAIQHAIFFAEKKFAIKCSEDDV